MLSQIANSIRLKSISCFCAIGITAAGLTLSTNLSAQEDAFSDEPIAPEPNAFLGSGAPGRDNDFVFNPDPITTVKADISFKGETPKDSSDYLFSGSAPATARTDNIVAFHWEPSNFFHHPLYFDDTPLERYGQSICPKYQPFLSTSRFFLTFPVLPYKMGVDRVHDCVSTLGYYRPGSCAPNLRERIVPAWERDATLLEAGTALALIFALP